MPPQKQFAKLQVVAVKVVARELRRLCMSARCREDQLRDVLGYMQLHLSQQVQAYICRELQVTCMFGELQNEKLLTTYSQLHAEQFWLPGFLIMEPMFNSLKGHSVKSLKVTGSALAMDYKRLIKMFSFRERHKLAGLYRFFRTLTNLTTFECSFLGSNTMLETFSFYCPHLETVSLDLCICVDDGGVFYLAGHVPTYESYMQIKNGEKIPSKSVCKKLRRVRFKDTSVSYEGVVMLLSVCPNIEELNISSDIILEDVFKMFYGTSPKKHERVKSIFPLKVFHAHSIIEEDILALIVKTCPHLEDIALKFTGEQDIDKFLLSTLLTLKIVTLKVVNCNTMYLLRYLKRKGAHLLNFTIEHCEPPPVALTFTRTDLQDVIHMCPKLEKFTLKLNNCAIAPDLTFEPELLHFQSLSHLRLEEVQFTPGDLSILVSKCKNLSDLHIFVDNLDMLDDHLLCQLLDSGNLQNLENLFLYKPLITLVGLLRLLDECPFLHTVGPLSTWCMKRADFESLAKQLEENNWDLDIRKLEIQLLYHKHYD